MSARWPEHSPSALALGVRMLVPLVQVPPRAVWGAGGQARHTSAETWLGRSLDGSPSLERMVMRYLAAFGPASVADVQAWSGLKGLREVVAALRPGLRVFRDEHGRELFDLPGAPRPDPGTPAPVRLAAEFDNLILGHADRSRIISDQYRRRLFTRNGIFPGTVLIDGFVAGMWRVSRSRGTAALTVELFAPVPGALREEIAREGERLLAFGATESEDHDIWFGALQASGRDSML